MLPSVPKTLGRLSDVFASSLGAITGQNNSFGFKNVDKALVIVVDGLGSNNLNAAGGHARFLNRGETTKVKTFCGFPSTTATSLTSFGTGMSAGEHGIVGYKVLDPDSGAPVNQLTGWSEQIDPLIWQPSETIAERARRSGVQSYAIGPREYSESGFTKLTMRGATYLPAGTILERLEVALSLLSEVGQKLIYLYIPELDQRAHAFGVNSLQWLSALEELDSDIEHFAGRLANNSFKNVGVALTADHGVIDIPADKHFFLDQIEIPEIRYVAGEPRINFVYLESGLDAATIDEIASSLNVQASAHSNGDGIRFATKDAVVDAGWYGNVVSEVAKSRMPDVFAIAVSRNAVYHRDFTSPRSQLMIGQHGGVDPDEIAIPLITFGAFAK